MTRALSVEKHNVAIVKATKMIVLGLVAIGWSYSALQLFALDAAGSLAEAGPGMQLLAALQYYLLRGSLRI